MNYWAHWLVFASATCLYPDLALAHDLKLLPTEPAERRIRALHAELQGNALTPQGHTEAFSKLEAAISDFIIAQLEAEPRLQPRHLCQELLAILGRKNQSIIGTHQDSRTGPEPEPAFIQRSPPNADSEEIGATIWGVTYSELHHAGFGGQRIVIESYVVTQGRARLAGRGGSELDGVSMNADRMWHPQPGLAVLIHGIVEWSSGHSPPFKAALYSIDKAGVHLNWNCDAAGLRVLPEPNGEAFTLLYHDEKRHQASGEFRLTNVVEVYQLEDLGLKRIIRRHY